LGEAESAAWAAGWEAKGLSGTRAEDERAKGGGWAATVGEAREAAEKEEEAAVGVLAVGVLTVGVVETPAAPAAAEENGEDAASPDGAAEAVALEEVEEVDSSALAPGAGSVREATTEAFARRVRETGGGG